MDKKKGKPFGARLEAFLAGKGFYIVLVLCAAVIGVSAWSMLGGGGEKESSASVSYTDPDDAVQVDNVQPVLRPEATEPAGDAHVEIPADPIPAAEEKTEETTPAAVEAKEYYIWPVAGPVDAPYSMDALAYSTTMRDWRTHDGVDIAAEQGTQVKAVSDGTVTAVFADDLLGTTVQLTHRSGLVTTYANLAAQPAVAVGDHVGVGQVLGAVGDTALCEIGQVSHLHLSMSLDGKSVDPAAYLP